METLLKWIITNPNDLKNLSGIAIGVWCILAITAIFYGLSLLKNSDEFDKQSKLSYLYFVVPTVLFFIALFITAIIIMYFNASVGFLFYGIFLFIHLITGSEREIGSVYTYWIYDILSNEIKNNKIKQKYLDSYNKLINGNN